MLDEHTYNHCLHVQKVAEEQGMPLFATLDKAGLIVTDEKRALISQLTVAAAIMQLEDQQHTVLAALGGEQTVTGAVKGCLKFLEMFARGLK